jgi:ribosomal-protein-alanine N-acetyltransferase
VHPEDVRLRGYQAGDVDAMYTLDVACFDARFRFSRRAMRRYAEAANALVVVAELESALVGFAIAHLDLVDGGVVGYVVTLDVAEAVRRQGLAARLMQQLEAESLTAGCDAMALHVFTGNEGAIGFYERMGYERRELAKGFYAPGVDAWVYRKALSTSAIDPDTVST